MLEIEAAHKQQFKGQASLNPASMVDTDTLTSRMVGIR